MPPKYPFKCGSYEGYRSPQCKEGEEQKSQKGPTVSDTPETDSEAIEVGWNHMMVDADFARKLERERDQARQKIERQAERIRYLEGATNHATGTPLSQALKERDKARSECARLRETIAELLHEPPLKITLKSKP
jgi:hypothetical protein